MANLCVDPLRSESIDLRFVFPFSPMLFSNLAALIPRRELILYRMFPRIVLVSPKQINRRKDLVVRVNVVVPTQPEKHAKASAAGYPANRARLPMLRAQRAAVGHSNVYFDSARLNPTTSGARERATLGQNSAGLWKLAKLKLLFSRAPVVINHDRIPPSI